MGGELAHHAFHLGAGLLVGALVLLLRRAGKAVGEANADLMHAAAVVSRARFMLDRQLELEEEGHQAVAQALRVLWPQLRVGTPEEGAAVSVLRAVAPELPAPPSRACVMPVLLALLAHQDETRGQPKQ